MPLLAAWLHDLDPVALPTPVPPGGVRWYGVSYLAAFALCWLWLHAMAKRRYIALSPAGVTDALTLLIIGVLAGGRLGYVLFYQPSLLWTFEPAFPWWQALNVARGGMASHGGMVGVLVACWFIARRAGAPTLHVVDAIACVAPVGLMLGRLANFVNGELLGRIVADPGRPAPWWAVRYPQELTERAGEVAARWTDEQQRLADELLARFAVSGDPVASAIDALHRGDAGVRAAFNDLLTARHPSQLYQALAEGPIVLAALWAVWARPRRPGVVTAWFLIVYGIGRVGTEFVRLPDAHLATARLLGLSRGQWLSVGMIVVGAVLVFAVTRRAGTGGAPRYGGWLASAKRDGRAASGTEASR